MLLHHLKPEKDGIRWQTVLQVLKYFLTFSVRKRLWNIYAGTGPSLLDKEYLQHNTIILITGIGIFFNENNSQIEPHHRVNIISNAISSLTKVAEDDKMVVTVGFDCIQELAVE